ncbi:hypothetical protein OROHE_003257 [Orobanche hederae]
MGIEKQGSRGGNYVGGLLQMFDWNAKSRKKLFLSKSDVPEQSKQKKRCDGNLPTTRLQMMEVDETRGGSSIKEGSDYSCSSSLMDEDFYGPRPPGVVARLMGLDSLPKSTPLFDTQSLHNTNYYQQTQRSEHYEDQITKSGSLHNLPVRKVIKRPIEKFQTEILPPKSAKSIPITHHKLLSPIKSAYFTTSKDPARIMEAASRLIDPGRRPSSEKTKLPPIGSSAVPLRVADFKEKARSARKPSKVFEGSQGKSEPGAAKKTGHSVSRSCNLSADSENKVKSVSLALQAKANVQKREGLNLNKKEPFELSTNNLVKSQPASQRSTLKKPCNQNGSNVLRQNNQKQNCIVDRGKSPDKCNLKKVSSRKLGSEVKDDKSKIVSSSSERVARKKRSVDGNYHQSIRSQPVKNAKVIQSESCGVITDRPSSWDHDSGKVGTDVVSFTFTAPMTRSGWGPVAPTECKVFSAGSQSKRPLVSSDGMSSSRFSYLGHNMKGGDALNTLLEQKLKELAEKVEFSHLKSSDLRDVEPDWTAITSSTVDAMEIDNQDVFEESSMSYSNISQASKLLDCRLPSPVSVLELSPFAESWNSSDTTDSNSMGVSKQCSSVQAQELLDTYSSKMFLTVEGDLELSDSASSNSTIAKRRQTTLNLTNCGKSKKWELEYVKEILSDIEPMFEDYASGHAQGVVKPHLFGQLECSKGYLRNSGNISRSDKRLLFDCVSECLDLKCRRYISGGCRSWAKGLSMVRRKERLAEEVCEEISGWNAIGDSVIDELVDKDMSGYNGKWVDFDIEAFELGIQIESRVLNSLIDEVVADILVL